jgi:hypothetical protein
MGTSFSDHSPQDEKTGQGREVPFGAGAGIVDCKKFRHGTILPRHLDARVSLATPGSTELRQQGEAVVCVQCRERPLMAACRRSVSMSDLGSGVSENFTVAGS